MFFGNKKCRIYAAFGVSQTPIKLYYRKERENSCYNFDLLINDEYKKMYKILEKYEWL